MSNKMQLREDWLSSIASEWWDEQKQKKNTCRTVPQNSGTYAFLGKDIKAKIPISCLVDDLDERIRSLLFHLIWTLVNPNKDSLLQLQVWLNWISDVFPRWRGRIETQSALCENSLWILKRFWLFFVAERDVTWRIPSPTKPMNHWWWWLCDA